MNERVQAAIRESMAAADRLRSAHSYAEAEILRIELWQAIKNVALVARAEALTEALDISRSAAPRVIEIRRNDAIRELEESMHSKRDAD